MPADDRVSAIDLRRFLCNRPTNVVFSDLERPEQQIQGSGERKATAKLHIKSKGGKDVRQDFVDDRFGIVGRNQSKQVNVAIGAKHIGGTGHH